MRPFASSLRSLSLSIALIYVLMISLLGPVMIRGQEPGPSPSPSPSATPSPSPTPAESPTPTPSPTPTQGSGGLPVHGAPYANLPNLDEIKAHPTLVTPQIIEPVPSVLCSPAQPDCWPEPAPSPSPSPSPSPTPGQGQGQAHLRSNRVDGQNPTGTQAVAWSQGPTRRLARVLRNETKSEKNQTWFSYLAVEVRDMLKGKRTGEAPAVNRYAASPLLQKYLAEKGLLVAGQPLGEERPADFAFASMRTAVQPVAVYTGPTWDELAAAMLDPINRTGGTDPLSRNFHWSLGLAGLPGRAGLNAGLTLNYNSLIWTKTASGGDIAFDLDRGFPTPGFRLGFPVIYGPHVNAAAGVSAYLMITPDGGRVELRQVGSTAIFEAADSSHLQLTDGGHGQLLVRTTDGTALSYEGTANGFRCTQIKDRNGNYLTIVNDLAGRLQTVTDTLGRVFTVNYDEYDNPLSITQTRGGSEFTWATFGYGTVQLAVKFDPPALYGVEDGAMIPVLNQVGLPDGSYYTFDYNGYAQVKRVNYYAADDHLLNYVANDLEDASAGTLADCPRIGAVSVMAENWNRSTSSPYDEQEATTTFAAPVLANCSGSGSGTDCLKTVVTVVASAPHDTEQRTYYKAAGDWDYGLPMLGETWAKDSSSPSTRIKQRWVTTAWDQDNTSVTYMLNPRVTETNVYDSGNQKRTVIGYRSLAVGCGTSCSTDFDIPNSITEYDADATTVLRTTETDYLESTNYLDRRIIGLPVEKRVYEGTNSGTLMAKTGFYYDETGFLTAQGSSIPQFDVTNYGSSFYYRGNLTKIRQYEIGTSNTKDSRIGYNTTGSVILTRDPLSHDTTISYADNFSDTYNRNTYAYPKQVTGPDGNHSDMVYYFHTGQKTHAYGPDLDGSTAGSEVAFTYDTIDRLYISTNVASGAHSIYYYATSGTNVTSYTTIKDLSTYTVNSTITDGAGRTIATATEHPGSSGGYKAQTVKYDILGRPDQTSNPTEINGGFVPAGDDYTAGWQYTEQTYDWKGRPLVTTHPDSTTRTASYSGCGCAGGEVVTLQDEGTMISSTLTRRRQTITKDGLGRTIKAVTYNWDGTSIYSSSTSDYNALDQVISTKQYQGDAGGSSPYQESTFTYDGYARLYTRHEPIFASSTYTTYSYNADNTIHTTTDPRGAVATFSYNNRRMVTGIEYSAPSGITVPDAVEYEFDSAGNRTSMTDGSGSVEYAYNQQSQLTSETREFDGLSGSFTLTYTYSLAGALASIEDAFGAEVDYAHDSVGRVTDITGSGFGGVTTYASNREFRAWGAVKAMDYGNSLSMTADYNNRMKMTDFSVPGIMGAEIDYQPEGSAKYVHDTVDNKFDRAYTFDHAARLSTALTGEEARGGTTADGPYHESFAYDPWGHMVDHDTRHWTENYTMSATSYTNDRHEDWTYDAAGNATQQAEDTVFSFDAAGRKVSSHNPAFMESCGETSPYLLSSTNVTTYDGDGKVTKVADTRSTGGGPGFTFRKYYLRSSVLGGRVLDMLSTGGAKQFGYVYVGGQLLAKQWKSGSSESVLWAHSNPVTGSIWNTNGSGTLAGREEIDPFGSDVGIVDPYLSGSGGGGSDGTGDCEGARFSRPRLPIDNLDGDCLINHAEAPRSMCMRMLGSGAGYEAVDGLQYTKNPDGTWRIRPAQFPDDPLYNFLHGETSLLKQKGDVEVIIRDRDTGEIIDSGVNEWEHTSTYASLLPNAGVTCSISFALSGDSTGGIKKAGGSGVYGSYARNPPGYDPNTSPLGAGTGKSGNSDNPVTYFFFEAIVNIVGDVSGTGWTFSRDAAYTSVGTYTDKQGAIQTVTTNSDPMSPDNGSPQDRAWLPAANGSRTFLMADNPLEVGNLSAEVDGKTVMLTERTSTWNLRFTASKGSVSCTADIAFRLILKANGGKWGYRR